MSTVADSPVLLEVTRGDRVESLHRGRLVLLDASGGTAVVAGDVAGPTYARSSLKPLQAAALVRAGWSGTSEAVALAAASHNAEQLHRDGVGRTLAAAGLTTDALGCPPALPAEPALVDYVAGGGVAAPVCHNCSGKHAAMTAACVAAGWDVATYLEPSHPLQRAVVAEIEAQCGEPIGATSIDGCGAPAHAISLVGLARGFARLAAAPATTPEGEVATAMRAHPQLLGGTGRAVSELMDACDGLIAKDGAEGIWAAALPDGRAFAAKIEDGAARALPPLLAAVLTAWGFTGPVVERHAAPVITGGGEAVGTVRWSAALRDLLPLPDASA